MFIKWMRLTSDFHVHVIHEFDDVVCLVHVMIRLFFAVFWVVVATVARRFFVPEQF